MFTFVVSKSTKFRWAIESKSSSCCHSWLCAYFCVSRARSPLYCSQKTMHNLFLLTTLAIAQTGKVYALAKPTEKKAIKCWCGQLFSYSLNHLLLIQLNFLSLSFGTVYRILKQAVGTFFLINFKRSEINISTYMLQIAWGSSINNLDWIIGKLSSANLPLLKTMTSL